MVRGGDHPALAFGETTDTVGLLCWLFKDQLLAKINAALDEAADDKAALTREQREEMEATITTDALAVERAECAAIWHADARGEVIDFRRDTTPQALLGLRLVVQPRAMPPESSTSLALDFIAPR
jgi:hypothetical protein